MKDIINMARGTLEPLTKETAVEISKWEYKPPYEAYSFKGHHDEYLLDKSIWGTEAPEFTGKGSGAAFVNRCVQEIRRVKGNTGRILLRVSAQNKRAITAYQKAGFRYAETIQDEIAFSDNMEDFWVMEL